MTCCFSCGIYAVPLDSGCRCRSLINNLDEIDKEILVCTYGSYSAVNTNLYTTEREFKINLSPLLVIQPAFLL